MKFFEEIEDYGEEVLQEFAFYCQCALGEAEEERTFNDFLASSVLKVAAEPVFWGDTDGKVLFSLLLALSSLTGTNPENLAAKITLKLYQDWQAGRQSRRDSTSNDERLSSIPVKEKSDTICRGK